MWTADFSTLLLEFFVPVDLHSFSSFRIDRIEVRWIGGGVDVVENVPADRLITITEGKGEPDE